MAEQDKLTLEVQLKTQIDRKFERVNTSLKKILRSTRVLQKSLLTIDDYLLKHQRNVNSLARSYSNLQRKMNLNIRTSTRTSTRRVQPNRPYVLQRPFPAMGRSGDSYLDDILGAGLVSRSVSGKAPKIPAPKPWVPPNPIVYDPTVKSFLSKGLIRSMQWRNLKDLVKHDVSRAASLVGYGRHYLGAHGTNLLGQFGITPKMLGWGGAGIAAYKFGKASINAAMADERAEIKMRTIFKDHSLYLKPQLDKLAARTPLSKDNLYASSITLGASGMQAGNIANMLRRLGDIAGGDPYKLQTVATAYSRTFAMGNLQGQEKNMIMDATGANLLKEVASLTGESVSDVANRMRQGKVSIDEVTAAIEKMTDVGGKFYRGMESMSRTTIGQISTLKDNWNSFLIQFGKAGQPVVNPVLQGATWGLQQFTPDYSSRIGSKGLGALVKSAVASGLTREKDIVKYVSDRVDLSQVYMSTKGASLLEMISYLTPLGPFVTTFRELGEDADRRSPENVKNTIRTRARFELSNKARTQKAKNRSDFYNMVMNSPLDPKVKGQLLREMEVQGLFSRTPLAPVDNNLKPADEFLKAMQAYASFKKEDKPLFTPSLLNWQRIKVPYRPGVVLPEDSTPPFSMSYANSRYREEMEKYLKAQEEKNKTGGNLEELGQGIQAGGRRVQQVNIEVEQMIGQFVENQTGVTKEKLQNALVELIPEMKKVLGTLQTSV